MLEALTIWFVCSILGITYQILIKPGEILQYWSRYVNFKMKNDVLKKLLLCPYCLFGQCALWVSIITAIVINDITVFISVPLTIITVYHYMKHD